MLFEREAFIRKLKAISMMNRLDVKRLFYISFLHGFMLQHMLTLIKNTTSHLEINSS